MGFLNSYAAILGGSFDAYVHPSGTQDMIGVNNYNSIATCFSTEGAGKNILIESGAYTETSNLVMESNTFLVARNPTITLNGCNLYILNKENINAYGSMTLSGSGGETNRRLAMLYASYSDFNNCNIIVSPSGDGLTPGSGGNIEYIHIGNTVSSRFKLTYSNISTVADGGMIFPLVGYGAIASMFDVQIYNFQNTGTSNIIGLALVSEKYNLFKCIFNTIISSGGTESPLQLLGSTNQNYCYGVNYNAGSVVDNGASNIKTFT